MQASANEFTKLLSDSRTGERGMDEKVFEVVYQELRRLAAVYFRNERPNHTLQPTALVNEACLRLLGGKEQNWENKAQFFNLAATAMRHVLIDHARTHLTKKRAGRKVQLDEALKPSGQALDAALVVSPEKYEEIIGVHEALEQLAKVDARQAQIVELRYFGGRTEQEVSDVFGISVKTVEREYATAKSWLRRLLLNR